MLILVNIFILIGLFKLLNITENPLLCAGVYAGMRLFFSLVAGAVFWHALIISAIVLVASFIYFWLLDRFEESFLFWLILPFAIVIVLL